MLYWASYCVIVHVFKPQTMLRAKKTNVDILSYCKNIIKEEVIFATTEICVRHFYTRELCFYCIDSNIVHKQTRCLSNAVYMYLVN